MRERSISLPNGGMFAPYGGEISDGRWTCQAEAAAWSPDGVMALGVTRWQTAEADLTFRRPVDILYSADTGSGTIFSATANPMKTSAGLQAEAARWVENNPRNILLWERNFSLERAQ